jgi:TRAP-type C4-dicarboxylate transport system substrate-binding protein
MYILTGVIIILALIMGACEKQTPAPPATTPSTPSTPEPEAVTPIELTYGSILPPNHPGSISDLAWIEKIQSETGGRVTITPFWAGTLINPRESVTDLANGVADIAFIIPQYGAGVGYDIHDAMEIGFYACPTPEISLKVYYELTSKYPELPAEFNQFKALGLIPGVAEQLHTTKPITKIDDIKGLTIRAVRPFLPVLPKLGAEGAPVPMGEVYVSLEKGLLDGVEAFFEVLKTYNIAEVTDYTLVYNFMRGTYPGKAMNLDSWNKLPADVQKVFDDNYEWNNQNFLNEMIKAEDAGYAFAKDMGHKFNELSPEEAAKFHAIIKSVCAEKAAELDSKGFAGTEIFNEISNLIEKYSK